MKTYIGIDNGVTGSIGIISIDETVGVISKFHETPTFKAQNYTKKKDNITRIDVRDLKRLIGCFHDIQRIIIERPMVNPGRFKATLSAVRALEATMCVIEEIGLSYSFIDSKEWQKTLLPQGLEGTDQLKKASMDVGVRLFPTHAEAIKHHKDADGLLIAEYCRKSFT